MEGVVSSGSQGEYGVLDCNICLGEAIDPVLTSCGHLFCWTCLYRWLGDQPKPCPVCRNVVRKEVNIFPVFSKGDATSAQRDSGGHFGTIPPRPQARRYESFIANPGCRELVGTLSDCILHLMTHHQLIVEREQGYQDVINRMATEQRDLRRQKRHMRRQDAAMRRQNDLLLAKLAEHQVASERHQALANRMCQRNAWLQMMVDQLKGLLFSHR